MSDIALYHIVDEALEGRVRRPGCTCPRIDLALVGCDCEFDDEEAFYDPHWDPETMTF